MVSAHRFAVLTRGAMKLSRKTIAQVFDRQSRIKLSELFGRLTISCLFDLVATITAQSAKAN